MVFYCRYNDTIRVYITRNIEVAHLYLTYIYTTMKGTRYTCNNFIKY